MRWLFKIAYPVVCIGIGWALGATYRAPPIIIETTDKVVIATRDSITKALEARDEIIAGNIAFNDFPSTEVSPNDGPSSNLEPDDSEVNNNEAETKTNNEVAPAKAKKGPLTALRALTTLGTFKKTSGPRKPAAAKPGTIAPAPVTKEETVLKTNNLAAFVTLCKGTKVSNAPAINRDGHIINYKKLKKVGNVPMTMMPVRDACISSGFGPRKGRRHKGVDYYSKTGGSIFAAADGQIIEAEYRNDYGFTVLINHGNDYYTRYAHLEGFTKGVVVGAAVPRGFALGEMGKTAGYNIPIHLHFELLKGNYDTPKKSFGLTAVDLYGL